METASSGRVAAALASVYVIWGSTYLAMRIALEGYPPLLMAAIRFLMAGSAMYLWLRARGAARPTLKQWGSALVVGTLLLAIGNGLVAIAEQWVASSLASVMVASMPLFAAFFSGLFGRWPQRREWIALAVGAVGVVFLNLDGDLRSSVAGAIALIISPAAWAFGSVWSRRLDMPKGAMSSAAQMLSGGVVLAVVGSLLEWHRFNAAPPMRATLALAFLAVFGSIVGFSAYQFLLRNVRPALATSYAYVNPLVAVFLGILFGGEVITRWGAAGTALIVAAVALVALGGPKAPKVSPPVSLDTARPEARPQDARRAAG